MKAYLKFTGDSIFGFGEISKSRVKGEKMFKYMFECENGRIFFNSVKDKQIKGIKLVSDLTQEALENEFSQPNN